MLLKAKGARIFYLPNFTGGLTVLLLFICVSLFGQNGNLNTKISVSFYNTPFQQVFDELSAKSGCNFSFNAQLVPLKETTSFKADNKSLSYVLSNLLEGYSLDFKEVNNQIVIYPAIKAVNENNTVKKQKALVDKPKNIDFTLPAIYTDTVYTTIADTILIYDTVSVYLYDTIKVPDTVKIIIKTKERPINRKPRYPVYNFQFDYSYAKNSFKLKNNSVDNSFYKTFKASMSSGNSVQINASFLIEYESFFIQTGIGYSLVQQNWKNQEETKGGYHTLDTISRYYTDITDGDTVWVYITRDKWIETLTISKNLATSKYHYLNVPILAGYKFSHKKTAFEVKTGVIPNVFLTANGNAIVNSDSLVFEDIKNNKDIFRVFNMSGYFSLAFAYAIDQDFYLFAEPFYQTSLWSIYDKKYWSSQRISSPGIKFGIRKKL